jgi:hypothetical protein
MKDLKYAYLNPHFLSFLCTSKYKVLKLIFSRFVGSLATFFIFMKLVNITIYF